MNIRPEVTGRRPGAATDAPDWVELQRIVDLKEAGRLSSLSVDTLKREHADKIRRLSPRRLGMTVGNALAIGSASTA